MLKKIWPLLFLVSQVTMADVPVEEAGDAVPASLPTTQAYVAPSVSSPSNLSVDQRLNQLEQQITNLTQMNLLSQIKQLQQQVQTLQGQLEVQAHDLKVLQDQQKLQFQDIDQRLSQKAKPITTLSPANAMIEPAVVSTNVNKPADTTRTAVPALQMSDQEAYQAAYNFVKAKDKVHAVAALQGYLKLYPKGAYVGNAHYWLGEMLLAQGKNDAAMVEFNHLIQKFPQHPNVPDAKLKLGYVYYNKGQYNLAKAQFKKVQQEYPNTPVAQLATAKLEQMKLERAG